MTPHGRLHAVDDWSLDGLEPPTGVPFHEHVLALLPPCGRGPLPSSGEPLPDADARDVMPFPLTGGSWDGIASVRGGASRGNAPLEAAAVVLSFLAEPPSGPGLTNLLARLTEVGGPQAMDRLVSTVAAGRSPRLATLARWLCLHGVRREHLKVGLALLGISGTPEDVPLVTTLGLLEELSLYAVVALVNLLPDPESAIVDLGDQVDGWGRIHCVLRLRDTADADVRRWLLRVGYANRVMVEETAYVVATSGRLREALETETDDAFTDHAGVIIDALVTGGPAEDLADYPDGAAVIDRYLRRLAGSRATIDRLNHLVTIVRYLRRGAEGNEHLTAEQCTTLTGQSLQVIRQQQWRDVAAAALSADDLGEVKKALRTARGFGLDPVPVARQWLEQAPTDGYLWQTLLNAADADALRPLLADAERLLPLAGLATGPGHEAGWGPGYEADRCLTLILQRLRKFPGLGARVIEVGLGNRVVINRNMALRALARWPAGERPPGLVDHVERMAWSDPVESVRKAAGGMKNAADLLS